jgi:hypothetical protein
MALIGSTSTSETNVYSKGWRGGTETLKDYGVMFVDQSISLSINKDNFVVMTHTPLGSRISRDTKVCKVSKDGSCN